MAGQGKARHGSARQGKANKKGVMVNGSSILPTSSRDIVNLVLT